MLAPPELVAHAPVALGLGVGTFARYGLKLQDGSAILPREVVGHCMMLGLLALLAEAACGLVTMPPTGHAIAGAATAILSGRLVRLFDRKVVAAARDKLGLGAGEEAA
jgi:hypothetical protein